MVFTVPDEDYGAVWTVHLDTAAPERGTVRPPERAAAIRAGDAVTVTDRSQQLLLRLA